MSKSKTWNPHLRINPCKKADIMKLITENSGTNYPANYPANYLQWIAAAIDEKIEKDKK